MNKYQFYKKKKCFLIYIIKFNYICFTLPNKTKIFIKSLIIFGTILFVKLFKWFKILMLSKLNELQNLFRKGEIKIKNKIFNDYFAQYKFFLIKNEDNISNEISYHLINSKFYVIDTIDYNNEKYFIICVYHAVIAISTKNLHLNKLFNTKKSTFYVKSKETSNYFNEKIQLHENNSTNLFNEINFTELIKYDEEIESLAESVQLINGKQSTEWDMIHKSIIYYLILYSHQKLKIDRILYLDNYFNKKESSMF